jgi:hypothetical protein
MLADRDAAPGGAQAHGKMRVLKRYHLENYFLDAEVLAQCFSEMESADSWLCQPERIEALTCPVSSDQSLLENGADWALH